MSNLNIIENNDFEPIYCYTCGETASYLWKVKDIYLCVECLKEKAKILEAIGTLKFE